MHSSSPMLPPLLGEDDDSFILEDGGGGGGGEGDHENRRRRLLLEAISETVAASGSAGLTSREICESLPVTYSEDEILTMLSARSARAPRTKRNLPKRLYERFEKRGGETSLLNDERGTAHRPQAHFVRTMQRRRGSFSPNQPRVAYVSFAQWHKGAWAPQCPLCGSVRKPGKWTLLGGRYYASSTAGAWAALLRQIMPIVMCEACFRETFGLGLGRRRRTMKNPGGRPREVGVAVLPPVIAQRLSIVGTYPGRNNSRKEIENKTLQVNCAAPSSASNVLSIGLSPANARREACDASTGDSGEADDTQVELRDVVRIVKSFAEAGCSLDEFMDVLAEERGMKPVHRSAVGQSTPGKASNFLNAFRSVQASSLRSQAENIFAANSREVSEPHLPPLRIKLSSSNSNAASFFPRPGSPTLPVGSSAPIVRTCRLRSDGSMEVAYVAESYVVASKSLDDPSKRRRQKSTRKSVEGGAALPAPFFVTFEDNVGRIDRTTMLRIRSSMSMLSPSKRVAASKAARVDLQRCLGDFFWLESELRALHPDEAADLPCIPENRFIKNSGNISLKGLTDGLEHFLASVATHASLHAADAFNAFISADFVLQKAIYVSKLAGETFCGDSDLDAMMLCF